MTFLRSTYSEDLDVNAMLFEGAVLKTMLKNSEFKCFCDVYKSVKKIKCERNLIPNNVKLIEILLVNPATSCTPERSFFNSKKNLAEIIDDKQTI